MVDYRSSAVERKHYPPDCDCLYRYGADDHQSTCPCSERERVLQLHIGELEAALVPFAAKAGHIDPTDPDDDEARFGVPVRAWRHAAELVEGKP